MNITADPGLPYTISHTYFTINITKNKPFYLVVVHPLKKDRLQQIYNKIPSI